MLRAKNASWPPAPTQNKTSHKKNINETRCRKQVNKCRFVDFDSIPWDFDSIPWDFDSIPMGLGPCPTMTEHPRRDTDVILIQSKAPIELFDSR